MSIGLDPKMARLQRQIAFLGRRLSNYYILAMSLPPFLPLQSIFGYCATGKSCMWKRRYGLENLPDFQNRTVGSISRSAIIRLAGFTACFQ